MEQGTKKKSLNTHNATVAARPEGKPETQTRVAKKKKKKQIALNASGKTGTTRKTLNTPEER